MSIMKYISFPRELSNHHVSYVKTWEEGEFRINPDVVDRCWDVEVLPVIEGQIDGCITFWGLIGSTFFNNCFVNPFIYEFLVETPEYFHEQKDAIIDKYHREEKSTGSRLDYNAMDQELYKYWNKEQLLQNQVLCKYLHDNLNNGEFIEIYESWIEEEDERGLIFGPPTSEIVIILKELLNLPYPMKVLKIGERKKLVICKS